MYRLARNGGLDGDVVGVLAENLDHVDAQRKHDQSWYALCQERLAKIIGDSQEEKTPQLVGAGSGHQPA